MGDPKFETIGKFTGREFQSLSREVPGASRGINPGIGKQLGSGADAVRTDELRRFVDKEYITKPLLLTSARTAPELITFSREYSFIWIPNSTNTTDVIQVRIQSASRGDIPFLPGSMLAGMPFDKLYFTNAAIAGATMILMVAQNWPVDQLQTDT